MKKLFIAFLALLVMASHGFAAEGTEKKGPLYATFKRELPER